MPQRKICFLYIQVEPFCAFATHGLSLKSGASRGGVCVSNAEMGKNKEN